jgi:BA14K-like protein
MKKLISGLCAGGLAVTFALTSIPANSAPTFVPRAESAQSDVVQIQDNMKWRKNKLRYNGSRNGNNWNGNDYRRSGNSAYYNGHRGYPYQRRGYRQHNGFWFPAAAFIAGAVIGGAIINNNNNGGGSSHVEWCYDRYRSYRAYDNTFQPTYGQRRQCNSPFG